MLTHTSLLQVLTGDNWEQVMFSSMRASGVNASLLYFVTWTVLGRYVLLNLFMAVLMDSFETAHEKRTAEKALLAAGTYQQYW